MRLLLAQIEIDTLKKGDSVGAQGMPYPPDLKAFSFSPFTQTSTYRSPMTPLCLKAPRSPQPFIEMPY